MNKEQKEFISTVGEMLETSGLNYILTVRSNDEAYVGLHGSLVDVAAMISDVVKEVEREIK